MHNPALNLAPFGRWTLRDKAAQRRSPLRWASLEAYMRAIFLAPILLIPCLALASGDAQIIGKLRDGSQFILQSDCMYDDAACETIPSHYTIFLKKGRDFRKITTTSCNIQNDHFSCIDDPNSPFSGTIYTIKGYKGKCEKGDPMSLFVCAKNCARVPKTMTQDYWEC